MIAKGAWRLARKTLSEWNEDKAPRLGAALAYYTIFSLSPLLIVTIAIAGLVFGREAAQGQIVGQIQGLVGDEGARAVEAMIRGAARPVSGVLAALLGAVTLLLGAAGVFQQLKDALNTIWEVQPPPRKGVLGFVRTHFFSFTLVLGTGFLLLVSLVVSAGLSAIGELLRDSLPDGMWVWQALNFAISFLVVTLLFAMLFRFVPDARIAWGDVWIGAAVTSMLFSIGKLVIGLYLGRSGVASTYGAAGSLVVLLLWVYYSAQILFLGAEFTQVYANEYGSRVKPVGGAVPLTEDARARQGIPRTRGEAAAAYRAPAYRTPEAGAGMPMPYAPMMWAAILGILGASIAGTVGLIYRTVKRSGGR